MICDPANSRRVATAFGDHSVLEFPGYEAPAWLVTTAARKVKRWGSRCAPRAFAER